MPDDSDPRRDATREFLQKLGPASEDDNGAVLTGWVVVTEWMSPDGSRHLTRGWDHALAYWHATGMVHEFLYGDWPEEDE